jgi:glycerate kinase
MRVLVAPQEMKGSLTAAEAARAIADGVRVAFPEADIIELGLSDGGPGLVDVMIAALGGARYEAPCHDPLMRAITASFAVLDGGSAVIEMAAASGLVLLDPTERDPLIATTFGTGELIAAALDCGCDRIILGVGGSATVDGGAGAAQALGARFLDGDGRELKGGGAALATLSRIDVSAVDSRLGHTRLRIASDVTNALCGPTGAAIMFGPQKGASPSDVAVLEEAMQNLAVVVGRDFGVDVASMAGSGAAGGLGVTLVGLAGATIEPGFDLVAEVTGLRTMIAAVDIVITGEGRLDAQTAHGKTAAGVAALAHEAGKPVGVIAGYVSDDFAGHAQYDEIEESKPASMPVQEAMDAATELLRAAAARIAVRVAKRV